MPGYAPGSTRQRDLASGVWFRLRRVLADAEEAFAISADDADQLRREGFVPERCGRQLSPEKYLFFVDRVRLQRIREKSAIRVGLGPDFLAAHAVALLRFSSPIE